MDSSAESADGKGLRHFRYIAAGVALLLLLIASVVAYGGGGSDDRSTSSPNRSVPPVRVANARAFIDSIGVNTHLHYADTAYAHYPMVRKRLRELGVKHIRDVLVANIPYQPRRLEDLARLGIKANLIAHKPAMGYGSAFLKEQIAVLRGRARAATESVEGPNEYDNKGDPNWVAALRDYQRHLYRAVRSDPELDALPVLGPSLVPPSSHTSLADISAHLDRGNIHSYPGGQPPHLASFGRTLDETLEDARINSGRAPVMATESGYHNATAGNNEHPPASERAAGIYIPRLFLEYFRRGVERTYLYELIDENPDPDGADPEQHFGLLRNDFSPKPAYVALKNLIALLSDRPDKRMTGSLRHRLEGETEGIEQLLLKGSDGSFYLALWQSASVFDIERREDLRPPARTVTVRLEQPVALAERYRPGKSASPLARYANAGAIRLSVPADVIVVRLAPR
ncbi:MAG: hypothetical protein M3375_00235 [Actinomycetota bacterium]|nr:hypothetical protein [Actinomycetota bacterium]